MNVWRRLAIILGIGLAVPAGTVMATSFNSTNFSIDGVVGGSFGGSQTSSSYGLVSVGGESIVGNASGGSYKIGQGYISRLERSLQLTMQPGGLLAYYPLDTGSGKVGYDASATSNNLVFTGTPTWTTGKLSGGIITSSGNTLSSSSNPSFSYSALSVCSWARISSTGTTPTIVSQSDATLSTNNMWSLGFATGATTPQMSIRLSGTTYTVTSSTSLGTSTWGHICATYDGTDLKMYVNGSLAGTTTASLPISAVSTGLYIGARNTSVPLSGTVDEVKLFSRALSDKDVLAEYSAQNAGLASGLALQVTPGTSTTTTYDAVVQTDAPGYSLALNQNNDLTAGAYTIGGVSGSIASPVVWNEGVTKGLGFTLYGTNATGLPGTWNSGNSYAAIPGTATTMYNRTGFTGGAKDVLNMRLRLDVDLSKPDGDYTNQMTLTGTMMP